MAEEADRGKAAFLARLSAFNEERGASNNTSPTISKQPLDLHLLYNLVKNRGGFAEVCRGRHWKECAQHCGITISSSAAYTLKKQYMKHLLPFECKYDRNDIPVEVLISQTESATKSKHGKHGKGSAPSPGPGDSNSQGSVSSASTCSYPTSGTPNPITAADSSAFPPQPSPAGGYPPSQSSQPHAGQFAPQQYNGYGGYGQPGQQHPGGWPGAPPGPGTSLLPGEAGSGSFVSTVSAQDPFSDEMQPGPDRPFGQQHTSQPSFGQQRQHPHPQQQQQQQQQQQSQGQPRSTPPATPVPNSSQMPGHPGGGYPSSGGKPAAVANSYPGYGSRHQLPPAPHHPAHPHQQQHPHPGHMDNRTSPGAGMPHGQGSSSNSYGYGSSHPVPVPPHDSRGYRIGDQTDYNSRPAAGQPRPGQPGPPPGHMGQGGPGNGYGHYRQPGPPPAASPAQQSYYSQQQRYERPEYRTDNRAYDTMSRPDVPYGQQPQHPPQQVQHQPQHPIGPHPHPHQQALQHQPPPQQQQQQQQQQHVPTSAPPPVSTSGPVYSQSPLTAAPPATSSGGGAPAAFGQMPHFSMPSSSTASTAPVSSYQQSPAGPHPPQPPGSSAGYGQPAPLQPQTAAHPQMSSGGKPAAVSAVYPYSSSGHPAQHPQHQQQPPPGPHHHPQHHPGGVDSRSSPSASPMPQSHAAPAPVYPAGQPAYDPRYSASHAAMQPPHPAQPDRYPNRPEAGEYNRAAPPPQHVHGNGYPPHFRQQGPPHPSQPYYAPHQGQRYDSYRDSQRGYDPRADMAYGSPAQHPAGHQQQHPPPAGVPPSGYERPPHSQPLPGPLPQSAAGHPPVPPPLSQGKVPPSPGIGAASLPPSLYGPNRDQPQRFPLPPHAAPHPSAGPQTLHHPQQSFQGPYPPQFLQQPARRELTFPPNTVEATQPKLVKRRRMTARDVSQIEAWRLLMCLKSGLLAESTWALDVLSVLLYDDNTFQYFGLQSMPGLLNTLLEHFRKYLQEIFDGLFVDQISPDRREKGLTNSAAAVSDGPLEKEEDSESPAVSRYRIRKVRNRKVRKWYEIDEDLKENSHPESNATVDAGATDPAAAAAKSMSSILPANASPLNEQDHQPLVLLNGSLNFTLKSRDGKPVKIINCKNGTTPAEVERGWKSLLNCSRVSGDDFASDEVCEEWDETCHILTQFAAKQKFVRFVKLINNSSKKSANGPATEETAQVKQESQVPSQVVPSSVQPEDSARTEPQLESFPRFRETDKRKRKHDLFDELEEEAYCRDHPPLYAVDEYCEGLSRRCLCLSTLIRNLSFVPQNDLDMVRHQGLLLVLSRLMLLHHEHPVRKRSVDVPIGSESDSDSLFNEDDGKLDEKLVVDEDSSEIDAGSDEWYWNTMHLLLENTLVTLTNIAGQLDLSPFPEEVSLPLLDGLLHWAVCPSSYAQDNLPMTSISNLSPQRLALEVLVKLSIRDSNVDLILATPPWERLDRLFVNLSKMLSRNEDQTLREFALVLLVNLSSADSGIARAVALTGSAIPQLISFVEQSEHSAMSVAHAHGVNALRDNPELMGTTLDMVRRAALCLRHLSRIPENRPFFMIFQQRLLSLVMSQILDQGVAAIIADVMYECSLSDPSLLSSKTAYLPLVLPTVTEAPIIEHHHVEPAVEITTPAEHDRHSHQTHLQNQNEILNGDVKTEMTQVVNSEAAVKTKNSAENHFMGRQVLKMPPKEVPVNGTGDGLLLNHVVEPESQSLHPHSPNSIIRGVVANEIRSADVVVPTVLNHQVKQQMASAENASKGCPRLKELLLSYQMSPKFDGSAAGGMEQQTEQISS